MSNSKSHPAARLSPWPLFAAMCLICVGGISTPTLQASASVQTRNPEDFLIVDCLLPGQVRRLGRSANFMSARRPVRTSQADCEIRGGEYVSYDRANYQTALKVWMGQAELGNADAQNYVGEIYLKGLGTDPDYVKAREWFEKASAQGSKRARINLGYLYEQGLGVPKDMGKALNLYREASGITDDKLVFASTVTAEVNEAKAESASLRGQLASEQEKSAELRKQVGKLRSELRNKQKSYQQSQSELNDVRHKLDAEQARVGSDHDPRYAKLKTDAQTREAALSGQQQKLRAEQEANAKQLADAEAQIAKLKAREQELLSRESSPANDQDLAALRMSAAQMDTALRDGRARTRQLQQQLATNEQQRQDVQAKFDQARAALAAEHAQNEDSKRLLKLMETQLSQKRQQLASQRTQMASLQAQINSDKAASLPPGYTTASLNGNLKLEILQPSLAMTRGLTKPAASVPPAEKGIDIIGRVQAPAGLTSVSLNGQTVGVDAGGLFKTHVVLSGNDTDVHVTAQDKTGGEALLDFVLIPGPGGNAAGRSSSGAPSIDTLPRGVRLGKYYALVIGNDSYAAYPELKSASSDAKAIAGVLQSRYGYKVTLLSNANRFEILSALNDMREQLKSEDNLLVYYAGHGEVDKSQQGYWLPVDAQVSTPSSWISNRAISDILTTMEAKHVLVIADSCYSGTMTRSSLATFGGGMPASAWGDWVKTMVAGRSRTALTSGGVQPVADAATKGGHSVFAAALLSVLKDNNQLLTGQHLFREIAAGMALRSANAGLQQEPEYAPIQFAGHEAGEFFLMPGGARSSASVQVLNRARSIARAVNARFASGAVVGPTHAP
ncbi:MAG: caspase family protein [Rudaea sp.]